MLLRRLLLPLFGSGGGGAGRSRVTSSLVAALMLGVLPAGLAGASNQAGLSAAGGASGAGGVSAAVGCTAGTASDFNGDGVADVAIADPDATVNGAAAAGRVHVVYGAGKGSQTFSQAEAWVSGDPEAGDGFGFALASYDANGDGCSDLAVSTPHEALAAVAEAGNVEVLLGSPTGFGVTGSVYYSQAQADVPGDEEAGDRFGYSLAAGVTAAGAAFLVVGVPGEDLNNTDGAAQVDAGGFTYIRGTTKLLIHQDSTDVPGAVEANDQYGYAVAATTDHVAVSGPGEAIGEAGFAGTVAVFNHTVTSGVLGLVGAVDQDVPLPSGTPEPGDWFGRSLSMVSYIPSAGAARETLLAIGSPGEALNTNAEPSAGRLVTIDASGELGAPTELHQGSDGVEGDTETGDYFGWTVQLVNRTPGQAATWQNLLLAVGVPGEEGTGPLNDGGVQVFSMIGPAGDHDVWAQTALTGITWSREDGLIGRHIGASTTHLYVTDPFAPTPAVYAVPWANLTDAATEPVITYAPGSHGLPTDGVGTFGAAIA